MTRSPIARYNRPAIKPVLHLPDQDLLDDPDIVDVDPSTGAIIPAGAQPGQPGQPAEFDDAGSVSSLPAAYIQRAQHERHARHQAALAYYDAIWASEYGQLEKERHLDLWEDEKRRWLSQQASENTRRAYDQSMEELRRFLRERFALRWPWMLEPYHLVAWIDNLRKNGSLVAHQPRPLGERTISRHLAAGSSYYKHMIDCMRIVDGQPYALYSSAGGHPLPNPFESKTIKRPEIIPYGESKAIPTPAIRWIVDRLMHKANKGPGDYRDLALILTFYRTGYRAGSVLPMRWRDFEERTDGKEGAVFEWRGKGNKQRTKAMPSLVFSAIVAYLRQDGRYAPGAPHHIQPDDYIWRPLRTAGCQNFKLRQPLEDNRHITPSTANGILQKHLRKYFAYKLRLERYPKRQIPAEADRLAKKYHLHSMRHTFAAELAEASNDNILLVQDLLDHESAETTRIYIGRIKQPEDKASELLQQHLGW